MHILFVGHHFKPDSGAAAVRLSRLAHQLYERGHQVTVLTTLPHYPEGVVPEKYRSRFSVSENRKGLRIIQAWLWARPNPGLFSRLLSQLSFLITGALCGSRLERPDVIFVEGQPIISAITGWVLSRVKKAPYVVNMSDYWPEYLVAAGVVSASNPVYKAFEALANLVQGKADGIVAMLNDILTKVEARVGVHQHRAVINNAVDLNTFHPDRDGKSFRERYNLGNRPIVSFMGILGPHIDLATMLEAAAACRDQNACFLFAGAGQQEKALLSAIACPELSHCRWIGWLDHSEIPDMWAASDIVYWALEDNELDKMRFQAKLFEAMASGTPSVVAVEGLTSDVLKATKAGIAVPFGDADRLAREIRQLLNAPDYHRTMSQNARKYAVEHFDAARNVDAYESILRTVSTS